MHKMNMTNFGYLAKCMGIACGILTLNSACAQGIGGGAVAVDPLISNAAKAAVQKLGIELI